MPLKLRIESLMGETAPWEVTVKGSTATIGRGQDCNVVIPDPKKYLSRKHATIESDASGYNLVVNSNVNPVLLSGKELGYLQRISINDGDMITLGSYRIQVTIEKAPSSIAAAPPAFGADDPFSWLSNTPASQQGTDPFAEWTTPKKAVVEETTDPFADFSKPRAQPENDKNLVSGLGASAGDPFSSVAARPLDPLDILGGVGASKGMVSSPSYSNQGASAIDQLLGLNSGGLPATGTGNLVDFDLPIPTGTPSLDHVQPFNLPFTPPAIISNTALQAESTYDPFDFSNLGKASSPTASPMINGDVSELTTASVKTAPSAPSLKTPSINQVTASVDATHSRQLIEAYLKGLGLQDFAIPDEDSETFMTLAGELTRSAISGVMRLLLARSEMKKELRADDRTMLSAKNNNPLKMMASSEEALKFLFDLKLQSVGTFMPPIAAMDDACKDILSHEFALVAGMRAAVIGALKKCDPQAIEALAEKNGRLGGLLANKKAQLWDEFEAWYQKMEESMADDVDSLFEKDFLKAYHAQIQKLK